MDSSGSPLKGKKGLRKLWSKLVKSIRLRRKPKQPVTPSEDITNPPSVEPTHIQSNQQESSVATSQSVVNPAAHSKEAPSHPTPTISNPVSNMRPPEVPIIEAESDDPDESDQPMTEPGQLTHTAEPIAEPVRTVALGEKDEATRRYERAQAIFRKYNMEISEGDWEMYPKIPVERVSKSPRMRIKWTCHECKTTFGHDRICVECAHPRCKKCPRYPPRKKRPKTDKSKPALAPATLPVSGMASTGACHECQATFGLGTTECANCHHRICDRCLQETVARSQRPPSSPQPSSA